MTQLEVDFNNTAERGRLIKASLRRTPSWTPTLGESVRLSDCEGNACVAVVERVEGMIVFLAPDYKTWADSSSVVAAEKEETDG